MADQNCIQICTLGYLQWATKQLMSVWLQLIGSINNPSIEAYRLAHTRKDEGNSNVPGRNTAVLSFQIFFLDRA